MSNLKSIFFLLGAIAFCCALLLLLRHKDALMPMQEKARSALFDAPLDAVTRVTIDYSETRIGLERGTAKWHLTAPFAAQVEQSAVTRLLDALESAQVVDTLSFREMRHRELSLKDLGLMPARLQLVLEEAGQRDTLLFGATTASGKECYLRRNNDEQVLVLPATILPHLPATADDLRSRRLLHGGRKDIRGLEVRAPGCPYIALSRDEKGTWLLTQPTAAAVAQERAESLIDTLYTTPVNFFLWPTISNIMDVAETETAQKTRLALYGLVEDSGTQITVLKGDNPPARVVVGRTLPEAPDLNYILLPEGVAIGAISNSIAEAFTLTLDDLRDNTPFRRAATNLRRLQVSLDHLHCTLTQTNGIWRFETPFAGEASQSAVRATLEQLTNLKADTLTDLTLWRQQHNIEPDAPVSEVELQAENSTLRFTLFHGNLQSDSYNLLLADHPTVYSVNLTNLPSAFVTKSGLLALRGTTMLALPQSAVRRLAARLDGKTSYSAERESDSNEWRLKAGTRGHLNSTQLSTLLLLLENLNAERIEEIGFTQEQFAAYGLLEPWLELTIDVDSRDTLRRTLIVGRELSFGKRYAVVRGLDILFVLDNTNLAALAAPLVEQVE